jgi:hypothetical protein
VPNDNSSKNVCLEKICSVVDTFTSLIRVVLLEMCAVDLVIHLTNNKAQLDTCAAGSPVLHPSEVPPSYIQTMLSVHVVSVFFDTCGNEIDCSSSVVISETSEYFVVCFISKLILQQRLCI